MRQCVSWMTTFRLWEVLEVRLTLLKKKTLATTHLPFSHYATHTHIWMCVSARVYACVCVTCLLSLLVTFNPLNTFKYLQTTFSDAEASLYPTSAITPSLPNILVHTLIPYLHASLMLVSLAARGRIAKYFGLVLQQMTLQPISWRI